MKNKKTLYIAALIALLGLAFCSYQLIKKPQEVQQTPESRFKRGQNIPGKLYWAGSVQDKKVALTFDDGPDSKWTPRILDILKEKKVSATFFVIGKQAQKYPDVLRRIKAEGHVIGNHTFSHVDLTKLTAQQIDQEIEKCTQTIYDITGNKPRILRPPFGFHNKTVDDVVYAKGGIIVLWSLDTEDWTGASEPAVKARVLPKMQNGFIVLQHDGENTKLGGSVKALPEIIDDLQSKGYTFATISELLETEPYQ